VSLFRVLMAELPSVHLPAAWLVAARLANGAVGLVVIPIFIHFLGAEGFASWALLLATGATFTLLEFGMAPTYVKFAAPLIQRRAWREADAVLVLAALILSAVFALASIPVFALSQRIASLLQLRDLDILDAGHLLEVVFLGVWLRSVLQLGGGALGAARRFRAQALFAFLQSFLANASAAAVAIATRRLELALAAFWGAQVLVSAAALLAARSLRGQAKTNESTGAPVDWRSMLGHGLKVQVCDWAQLVSFQFDKFLIATVTGLSAVAPYEVANRSAMALRSLPSSGLDSFLPSAAIEHATPEEAWVRYRAVTRLAGAAVSVFMLAPLALMPVFLYAWTGQMGYASRGAFAALLLGFAVNVLTLPAAAMVQAAGRADLQARAAVLTLLLNVPLSVVLLLRWGMAGAALGTAIAMVAGAAMLFTSMHRIYARSPATTLRLLAGFWPVLPVCLLFLAVSWIPFEAWLAGIDPAVRFAWQTRLVPALACALAYPACVAALLAWLVRNGTLSPGDFTALRRWRAISPQ
jgi:O-antigen/teichoic acid export membrane protein